MHIDNRHFYGYLPVPLQPHQTLKEEKETFVHLLMEIISKLYLIFPLPLIQMQQIVSIGFSALWVLLPYLCILIKH